MLCVSRLVSVECRLRRRLATAFQATAAAEAHRATYRHLGSSTRLSNRRHHCPTRRHRPAVIVLAASSSNEAPTVREPHRQGRRRRVPAVPWPRLSRPAQSTIVDRRSCRRIHPGSTIRMMSTTCSGCTFPAAEEATSTRLANLPLLISGWTPGDSSISTRRRRATSTPATGRTTPRESTLLPPPPLRLHDSYDGLVTPLIAVLCGRAEE